MRRLLRRLFTFTAAVSLLLCVATGALWARSYWVYEHIAHRTPDGGAYVVRSGGGRLFFDRWSGWRTMSGWQRGKLRTDPERAYIQPVGGGQRVLGFALLEGTVYGWPGHLYGSMRPFPPRTDPRWWVDRYRAVAVPYWAVVALTAVLPAVHLPPLARRYWSGRRRRRRMVRGLCAQCGYDLRGSRDRCPECGALATAETTGGKAV